MNTPPPKKLGDAMDPMLFPSRWPQALGRDPQDPPPERTCPECGDTCYVGEACPACEIEERRR